MFNKANQLPPFTISEFKYSQLHIRLLHSVFDEIETDVRAWKSYDFVFCFPRFLLCSLSLSPRDQTKLLTDSVSHSDNQIFTINVVHIISQMADVLCNACGGLLPLLASATSASVIHFFNKKEKTSVCLF